MILKRIGRIGRLLLWLAAIPVVAAGATLASLFAFFPRTALPEQGIFEATPERLERGRYLVEHVADCFDCHSERDWRFYSGPVVEGTKGQGAMLTFLGFDKHSANITPHGIGKWSDGEIARAITSGVDRKGRALSPMMPYDTFSSLSRADLHAIVTYLRTLPPVVRDAPARGDPLLLTLLGRTLPRPVEPGPGPDSADSVEHGRYLVTIAECNYCHKLDFSGGASFRPPGGPVVVSPNITPSTSGIGAMSRDSFIGRFKAFSAPEVRATPLSAHAKNTVMPWLRYSGMTEEDLGAIFDFLRTVPPIDSIPLKE